MDRIELLLDGVTINHVGEVFFRCDATELVRNVYQDSYIKSLQDFALAVFVCDHLLINPELYNRARDPRVEILEESHLLIRELAGLDGTLIQKYDQSLPIWKVSPHDSTADGLGRLELQQYLGDFETAWPDRSEMKGWANLIARDYAKEQTANDELSLDKLPHEYLFRPFGKKGYITDPALLEWFSQRGFVAALSKMVDPLVRSTYRGATTGSTQVNPRALQALTAQVIVTHLAVHVNYRLQNRNLKESPPDDDSNPVFVYQPTQTRAHLDLLPHRLHPTFREFRQRALPIILLKVIAMSNGKRERFLQSLVELRRDAIQKWTPLRARLRELYFQDIAYRPHLEERAQARYASALDDLGIEFTRSNPRYVAVVPKPTQLEAERDLASWRTELIHVPSDDESVLAGLRRIFPESFSKPAE